MPTKKSKELLLKSEFYLKDGDIYRVRNNSRVEAKPGRRGYRFLFSNSIQQSITYGRVVFLLSKGFLPLGNVYHIDGDRANCHPDNLTHENPICSTQTA
ncbi:TPA: HNH endonuclease [Photobacterium damselae]